MAVLPEARHYHNATFTVRQLMEDTRSYI